MSTPIKRRNFLASFIAIFFLSRCKKESTIAPSQSPNPISTNPSPPPLIGSPDYLAQYTTTEVGTALVQEPAFISKIIKCYSNQLTYKPGDYVSLYISGARNNNQLITFTDANEKLILSINTPIDIQPIGSQKPWVDGLMFKETIKVKLPDNLKSGVYRFIANGVIIWSIICKSKSTSNEITIVHPSNTDYAYNMTGGKSVYKPDNARSTVSSFSRSIYGAADYNSRFFKWISQQSYDTRYITDPDLDNYSEIQDTKILIIAGHSEYWTRTARINVDKFIASGKNVLILSGNTMYFQVRYNTPKNLMICYKDKKLDPLGGTIYSTCFWADPLLQYPVNTSIGADFKGGGYGNKLPNRWNGYKITNEKSPLFEGTGLKNGDILSLPTVEYDGAPVVKMIEPGSKEIPVIDNSKLNFYKIELLGYDFAINWENKGLGTFIVFKKTKDSGTVVNVASTDWCSESAYKSADKDKIIKITKNMIEKSLNGNTLFSS
jgi:hypothetical protein